MNETLLFHAVDLTALPPDKKRMFKGKRDVALCIGGPLLAAAVTAAVLWMLKL